MSTGPAGGGLRTRNRLQELLLANQTIGSDLDLPLVMRRLVDAARDLIGAQYAALGIIAPDGSLSAFVHAGMPAEDRNRIGHLPRGEGLLGAVIDDPVPIRLPRIADDPRSSGFPPGHPAMEGFLGVPIRIREEVFGNLYLTGSTRGGFGAEDEELAVALAATAAVAIDNARLYATARKREDWLEATAAVTRHILSAGAEDPLRFIAERIRELAAADLVGVLRPRDDAGPASEGGLQVQVAVGSRSEDLAGMRVPLAGSLSGRVFSTGRSLRVSRPGEQDGLTSLASGEPDIGPVMVVPLIGSRQVNGVLTVARRRGRPPFTTDDLEMAADFANQASVAVELADGRAELERAALLAERDRIAADLHDHVIQRLFATGLTLHSIAAPLRGPTGEPALRARAAPGVTAERIVGAIRELDETISQIRTTIFALNQPPRSGDGLRTQLLRVTTEMSNALGSEPTLRFAGVLPMLPEDIAEDLVAVLREALSNVARHAHAAATDVQVTATPDRIALDVHDDGVGIGPAARRSGLANLRRRAERHGGTLTLTPGRPTGTLLSWTVPT